MIKILFVCHGNICRSPMAESVLTYLLKKEHLEHLVEVSSRATSREEIGNPIHYGTRRKLQEKGIPLVPHRAAQLSAEECGEYDYLIGMDAANLRSMQRIAPQSCQHKIYSLLSFAKEHRDIADPWYSGDFEATFQDVQKGCNALLDELKEQLLSKG